MRMLVTALASAAEPTGLAVYARMTSERLVALAGPSVRLISWDGRAGSGVALAASRARWLYLRLDNVARQAEADAVLHLLPEVGRTSLPQIVVLHDLVPLVAETTWRQRIYFRTVVTHALRSAAFVVADSEQTRRDAIEILRTEPDKIVIVHPGVDLKRFCPLPRPETSAQPFVLAVGSHAPHKRLDLLMRAFGASNVRRTHQLHIVGPQSPRYTPPLMKLCERLGLEQDVRFFPYDSVDELARRYAAADLYVSASSHEGFGLPALEALASGTPVVVTDVGAARAYVGDAGILVPQATSVDELAGAIERAIQLAADSTARARARRRAEGFSWDRTARGLLDAVSAFLARQ
jgi:glycosyltransferase involved in cell wall biosynthesis